MENGVNRPNRDDSIVQLLGRVAGGLASSYDGQRYPGKAGALLAFIDGANGTNDTC